MNSRSQDRDQNLTELIDDLAHRVVSQWKDAWVDLHHALNHLRNTSVHLLENEEFITLLLAVESVADAIRASCVNHHETVVGMPASDLANTLRNEYMQSLAYRDCSGSKPCQKISPKTEGLDKQEPFNAHNSCLTILPMVPPGNQADFMKWYLKLVLANQKSLAATFARIRMNPGYSGKKAKPLRWTEMALHEAKTKSRPEIPVIYRIEDGVPVILSFGLRRDLPSLIKKSIKEQ